LPNKSVKRGYKVQADVHIEIMTKSPTNPSAQKKNTLWRPNECLEACKNENPHLYVTNGFDLGFRCNSRDSRIMKFSENRMLIKCTIKVQMADFFDPRFFHSYQT